MRTPRLAGMGLATLAAAAMTVAGCDNGGTTPEADSSAPAAAGSSSTASTAAADPAAVKALADATAKLGTTSFKITATSGAGFKLTSAIDPAQGIGTADIAATGTNASLTVKSLLIGQDLYVKIPGVTKGDTWTHLDGSRLPAGANVGLRPGQIDPVDTSKLLASSTDVRATGGNSYAGTADLTKAAGLTGASGITMDGADTQLQQVPFTAGLDDQGRLSAMTITLPATNGQPTEPLEILYSGYGDPVTAKKPAAAEVTEAPESLYQTLGG